MFTTSSPKPSLLTSLFFCPNLTRSCLCFLWLGLNWHMVIRFRFINIKSLWLLILPCARLLSLLVFRLLLYMSLVNNEQPPTVPASRSSHVLGQHVAVEGLPLHNMIYDSNSNFSLILYQWPTQHREECYDTQHFCPKILIVLEIFSVPRYFLLISPPPHFDQLLHQQ